MMIENYSQKRLTEQGNVLITTLILMTMVLILGLNGIESVLLEQKVFSGFQNQNIAFNAAENALNKAEDFIVDLSNPMVSMSDSNYFSWDPENPSTFKPIRVGDVDWAPYLEPGEIKGAQEAFVIQYLGERPITGEKMGVDQRPAVYGSRASFFRIGAYGAGPQAAQREVDVVYATLR